MSGLKDVMGATMRQELEDLSAELQRRRELLETLSSGSALRAARLTGMPKAPRGSTQARFEADRIGAKMAVQVKVSRLEQAIMDRVTVITDHSDEILHAREKALLLRLRYPYQPFLSRLHMRLRHLCLNLITSLLMRRYVDLSSAVHTVFMPMVKTP